MWWGWSQLVDSQLTALTDLSHTVLSHCSLTLISHTDLSHCSLTLVSLTVLSHISFTVKYASTSSLVEMTNNLLIHSIWNWLVDVCLSWQRGSATTTSGAATSDQHPSVVVGIDIGTGANLVYPLLGCALHSNWEWVASDVDPTAVTSAKKLISMNGLESRIQLRTVTDTEAPPLLSALATTHPHSCFDFTCCNPPFYANEAEAVVNPKSARWVVYNIISRPSWR